MIRNSVWDVIERISRYTLAAVACISFAQFLLLIGVSTERAQRLAGAAFGSALLCSAFAAMLLLRRRKINRLREGPSKEQNSGPQLPFARQPEPNASSVALQYELETQQGPREHIATTSRRIVFAVAAVGVVILAIFVRILILANQNNRSKQQDFLEAATAHLRDEEKSNAGLTNTQTDIIQPSGNVASSSCPSAIPAGIQAKPLSPEQLRAIIGTKAALESGTGDETTDEFLANLIAWDAELHFFNGTNDCVSRAEVEVALQQGGSSFRERHTVSFKPILSPGSETYEYIALHRRTKTNGEPLAIQEWHITKIWGFHYSIPEH